MIEFREPREGDARMMIFVVVGIDCSHNRELLGEDLAVAKDLVRRRRQTSQPYIVGDWSIDQLPDIDFVERRPEVRGKHMAERGMLRDFAAAIGLKRLLPTATVSCAGGPWREDQMRTPLTRIPTGGQGAWPSFLGYALVPDNSEAVSCTSTGRAPLPITRSWSSSCPARDCHRRGRRPNLSALTGRPQQSDCGY